MAKKPLKKQMTVSTINVASTCSVVISVMNISTLWAPAKANRTRTKCHRFSITPPIAALRGATERCAFWLQGKNLTKLTAPPLSILTQLIFLVEAKNISEKSYSVNPHSFPNSRLIKDQNEVRYAHGYHAKNPTT